MKKLLILLVFLLSISLVFAIPQPSHRFAGEVTYQGDAVSDNNLVYIKIDGVTYAETLTKNGKYGYDPIFDVPADDPDTSEIEGGKEGDTIKFYVGDDKVDEIDFEVGGRTNLDLVALSDSPIDFGADSGGSGNGDSGSSGEATGESRSYYDKLYRETTTGGSTVDKEAAPRVYVIPDTGSDENEGDYYEKDTKDVEAEYKYPLVSRISLTVLIIVVLIVVIYLVYRHEMKKRGTKPKMPVKHSFVNGSNFKMNSYSVRQGNNSGFKGQGNNFKKGNNPFEGK